MLHEYGAGYSERAIDEAMAVPLAQTFALYAACRARYGCLNGAGYQDRDMIRKLEALPLKEEGRRQKEEGNLLWL